MTGNRWSYPGQPDEEQGFVQESLSAVILFRYHESYKLGVHRRPVGPHERVGAERKGNKAKSSRASPKWHISWVYVSSCSACGSIPQISASTRHTP